MGSLAALASALFLGLSPVFGKQAILMGAPPLAVVAWRTLLATLLLFGLLYWRRRSWLHIYPLGLVGCLLGGFLNGVGSLFYYGALGRIDASLGQLLYSLYPVFAAFWYWLDDLRPTPLTWLRIALAIPAIALLTQTHGGKPDWLGIGMMLLAAMLYALHLPINQRVLADVPAPTVTLYTLSAMTGVVFPTYLLSPARSVPLTAAMVWPIAALGLVTFLSRLTLFIGVKHLGGMQAALLGLGELLVTVGLSHLWLHERLNPLQWLGAALLTLSLLLNGLERPRLTGRRQRGGWLAWLRPPLPSYDLDELSTRPRPQNPQPSTGRNSSK